MSLAVRFDTVDHMTRHPTKPRLILKMHRLGLGRSADDAIQSSSGRANPQISVRIDVQRIYGVIAETFGIAIVAPVRVKPARAAFEQVQATAVSPNPKIANSI